MSLAAPSWVPRDGKGKRMRKDRLFPLPSAHPQRVIVLMKGSH